MMCAPCDHHLEIPSGSSQKLRAFRLRLKSVSTVCNVIDLRRTKDQPEVTFPVHIFRISRVPDYPHLSPELTSLLAVQGGTPNSQLARRFRMCERVSTIINQSNRSGPGMHTSVGQLPGFAPENRRKNSYPRKAAAADNDHLLRQPQRW